MTRTTTLTQPPRAGAEPGAARARGEDGASQGARVIVGVDTHQDTHTAAVLDRHHVRLGHREFPVTTTGYRDLLAWAATHGEITQIGVESTGSYGAGLTRHLHAAGHQVIEVNRPEKATRVKQGKSDPIDAYSAAEQVLTGRASATAKTRSGVVEAIRTIKVPRDAAVKNRTAAYSQLRDLITTAPADLHDTLIALSARRRVAKAAALRPDTTRAGEPAHATRHALRALARRIQVLDLEIAEADKILTGLTRRHFPHLMALRQVGTQATAQLAITAGQNFDRMTSEATFAKLTGVAPLPASSGKTTRHRLNRGGDRQANSALYMIAVGRMSNHPETRAYVQRRRSQGLSNRDIIRCLKRHLARSIYRALKADLATP